MARINIEDIYLIAGQVKLVCGMGNNAAWMVCLDALQQIQRHPNYRQNVKKAYKEAMEEFHRYERKLIYAKNNRMFHVADMTDEIRKKYGNITDRDYYDFWSSQGGVIYEKTKPFVTSLVNKYRLSLVSHGVPHPDKVAWVMTAMATLGIAVQIWESCIRTNAREFNMSQKLLEQLFKDLSLEPVEKMWTKALKITEPMTYTYRLTSLEEKNITQGLVQLAQIWIDPENVFGSAYANTKDWSEVFANKTQQKAVMKEILNIKKLTKNNPIV